MLNGCCKFGYIFTNVDIGVFFTKQMLDQFREKTMLCDILRKLCFKTFLD